MTRAADETRTAVYRVFDDAGNPLYYGQSHNPLGRLATHARRKPWIGDVAHVRIDWFPTLKDALDHERAWTLRDNPAWSEQGVTSYWPPIADDPAPRTKRARNPRKPQAKAKAAEFITIRTRVDRETRHYLPHELVTNVAEAYTCTNRAETLERALDYVSRRDREAARPLLDAGIDTAIKSGAIPLVETTDGTELFGVVTKYVSPGVRSWSQSVRRPSEPA